MCCSATDYSRKQAAVTGSSESLYYDIKMVHIIVIYYLMLLAWNFVAISKYIVANKMCCTSQKTFFFNYQTAAGIHL